MSLKRKASYPTIDPTLTTRLDDTPRHLSSRTRKRYRNDRPSDEVVYENTLRRLFSAQRQPAAITSQDEDLTNNDPLPSPETVDPRQHTLFKFFQPSRPSLTHVSANTSVWKTDEAVIQNGPHNHIKSPDSSIATGTSSPSSARADTDMELDREMDSGSDGL